jgi:hypothetical protein
MKSKAILNVKFKIAFLIYKGVESHEKSKNS